MAMAGDNRVPIEATDPLFLHPLDHPGQSLVTDVFNGDNFENSRHFVTIALSTRQNCLSLMVHMKNQVQPHLYFYIGSGVMIWSSHGFLILCIKTLEIVSCSVKRPMICGKNMDSQTRPDYFKLKMRFQAFHKVILT